MANRRMFSKSVVESGRFLKLSAAAQALYFQLGMRAEDGGVVEAATVMKKIGATYADLQELIFRGFVDLLGDEKELVVYLADWWENNGKNC